MVQNNFCRQIYEIFPNYETMLGKSCTFASQIMDRTTFDSRKPFAGKKKASMQRRSVYNDYTARRMYMITMVTEGRKPLFGKVVGRSDAEEKSEEVPHIELSPLGERVKEIWESISSYHREVKVVALPNKETPKIFAKVKSAMLPKYAGKKTSAVSSVDGVTGATYSSKAVKANVEAAVKYYKAHK